MPNFSDDEDEPVVAEARREAWSDDDGEEEEEEEEVETELVGEPARARSEPAWSDQEELPTEGLEERARVAGALFGKNPDPIGDLRTKAGMMARKAKDSADMYVKSAAKEAKATRDISTKIGALQREGQKKLDSVKKDKKLTENAKRAQEVEFESLVSEIARYREDLAAQESWFNQILSQRRIPASSKAPTEVRGSWNPEIGKFQVGPRGSTSETTADRTLVMHLPPGAELAWSGSGGGEPKVHPAAGESQHFRVAAGSKYQVTNRGDRQITYMTIS